jgi:hypothetical protein
MADLNPELQKRLSSWRHVAGVVEHRPDYGGETGVNEREVRARQRRGARMCVNTVKEHDAFIVDLKPIVEQGGRDTHYQQRVKTTQLLRFCCKKWRDVGEGLMALGISRC